MTHDSIHRYDDYDKQNVLWMKWIVWTKSQLIDISRATSHFTIINSSAFSGVKWFACHMSRQWSRFISFFINLSIYHLKCLRAARQIRIAGGKNIKWSHMRHAVQNDRLASDSRTRRIHRCHFVPIGDEGYWRWRKIVLKIVFFWRMINGWRNCWYCIWLWLIGNAMRYIRSTGPKYNKFFLRRLLLLGHYAQQSRQSRHLTLLRGVWWENIEFPLARCG